MVVWSPSNNSVRALSQCRECANGIAGRGPDYSLGRFFLNNDINLSLGGIARSRRNDESGGSRKFRTGEVEWCCLTRLHTHHMFCSESRK